MNKKTQKIIITLASIVAVIITATCGVLVYNSFSQKQKADPDTAVTEENKAVDENDDIEDTEQATTDVPETEDIIPEETENTEVVTEPTTTREEKTTAAPTATPTTAPATQPPTQKTTQPPTTRPTQPATQAPQQTTQAKKALESIDTNRGSDNPVNIYKGDNVKNSSVKVTAYYSDGSSKVLPENAYSISSTYYLVDGTNQSASVTYSENGVTVNANIVVNVYNPWVSIKGDNSVKVGESITLTSSSSPQNANISWSITSGSSYATLTSTSSAQCTVKGVKGGKVTVTASFTYNSTVYSKSKTITVLAPEKKLTKITTNRGSNNPVKIHKGSNVSKSAVSVTAYYSDGSSKAIASDKFTISSTSSLPVGTNQAATVTYKENGVTVTTTISVTIVKPTITISYNETEGDVGLLETGDSLTLYAKTSPANKDVVWDIVSGGDLVEIFSSNSSSCVIQGRGNGGGTAKVKASFTYAGTTYSTTLTFNVYEE